MSSSIYKTICTRCIYDSTVPNISFDETGVCNYCLQIEGLDREYPTGEEGERRIAQMIEDMKKSGVGKNIVVIELK